jgi:hypothetical protein
MLLFNNSYKKHWQNGTGVGEVGAGHYILSNAFALWLLNAEKCEILSKTLCTEISFLD